MYLLKSLIEFPVESTYDRPAVWCNVAYSSSILKIVSSRPQLVPHIYLVCDSMIWALRHAPNFDINDSNRKSFPSHLAVRSMVVVVVLLLMLLLDLLLWLSLMFDDLLYPNCHSSAFDCYSSPAVGSVVVAAVVAANRDVQATNTTSLMYFGWLAGRPKMPPKTLTILDMSSYRWNWGPNNR